MNPQVSRLADPVLNRYLGNFKSVAVLGPRQCGKSTLAKEVLKRVPNSIYLDLEDPSDRLKLTDPMLYFRSVPETLVCLDEIQLVPELFPVLRSFMDQHERKGQFLILGSASRDLIRQSSETLAGRIVYTELTPFLYPELIQFAEPVLKFVLRGGYPDSYLASDDEMSFVWRRNFISSFLERDISRLGFNYPPETMRRLWSFIAHSQGQTINLSEFGELLGVSHTTIRKYVDLLAATFMIRVLPPFETSLQKRMVKTPRIYIRDSGLLLSLLNIRDMDSLFSNPVMGVTWESMVIENILSSFGFDKHGFYRTTNGAEMDLVIERNGVRYGIECKSSLKPGTERGLYSCIEDLKLDEVFIVAPVSQSYPLKEHIRVVTLEDMLKTIRTQLF